MDSPELLFEPVEASSVASSEATLPSSIEALPTTVANRGALLASDRGRLRAVAQRVLRSADLAEDAVQNVWTRLFERGRLEGTHPAAMAHLVRLEALHLLRGRQRRHHHEEHACSSKAHDCSCCPSEAAERDEAASDLRRVVAGLPDVYRVVVERFELEGHDQACIALELGIAESTVRSRLTRARSLLRRQLELTDD